MEILPCQPPFFVPEVPINKFMAVHTPVSFNAQKENKLESLRSSSALKFSSSENWGRNFMLLN